MSKRTINSRNLSTKKPRVEESNDFWDDDFDEDVIDDCFKRATQIVEEERDDTLQSSYSVFKDPRNMFTSTQQNPSNQCTLEDRIKQLQEKFAEKEGEVSILRTNLQHLRASSQVDQEKKQKEWTDKFSALEKENKSIKSELEFKNLEVANLKHQITELLKLINTEQKTKANECKTTITSPQKKIKEVLNENTKIHINTVEFYPLKNFTFSFLHNNSKMENTTLNKKIKDCDLGSIYSELFGLANLSHNELDSEVGANYVNKVVDFSFQQLKKFRVCMQQNEDGNHLLDVSELDQLYLQNNSLNKLSEFVENCGEIVQFLAEVVPFSTHLTKYLLSDQSLNSKTNLNEQFVDIPASQYLLLLLDLISMIVNTRTEKFSNFVRATISLLCRLSCEDACSLKEFYETVTKKLLLFNDVEIIVDFTLFLKMTTQNPNFNYSFCYKSSEEEKSTKGVCSFHAFMVLLEKNFQQIEDPKMLSLVISNVLGFIYNIFKENNSLLHQETNICRCLSQLYKLIIAIIYRSLKNCRENPTGTKLIRKKGMKILSLLSFNSYELTQKYVKEFAQFKEILAILSETCDEEELANLKYLEKLSLAEDLPEVKPEKFLQVDL